MKEKNKQNKRKGRIGFPFFLHKRNKIKQNSRILISVEAARDNKCFTSEGYGLIEERLNASGIFFKKLRIVGFKTVTGMGEPPCRLRKLCCLFTTAFGKSNFGLIYFKEIKAMANSKYAP